MPRGMTREKKCHKFRDRVFYKQEQYRMLKMLNFKILVNTQLVNALNLLIQFNK
jgi:hypothetical protein